MIEGLSKKQSRIIGSVVILLGLSLLFHEFTKSRKTTLWYDVGETKAGEGPSKRENDHLSIYDFLKHGFWTEWYKNGQKEEEGNWKIVSLPSVSDLKRHGSIKDGLWTGWYENGQKSYEGTWKTDSLRNREATDGLWTYWYENGQKSKEITYKDGDRIGLWTAWYKNGQKQWEENYIHINTVDTGIYYTEDGSIKEPIDYLISHSFKISNYSGPLYRYLGKDFAGYGHNLNVYTMKGDIYGDGLSTHWYRNTNKDYKFVIKNGQKSSEGTIKGSGRTIGIWTYWYENGQKKEEGTYSKDGKQDGLWTGWYENGQKKEEVTYKAMYFELNGIKVDRSKVISQECWDAEGNEKECD